MKSWQNGIIVETSGTNSIFDIYPGQSQNCCYVSTRYTINDQTVRVVVSNVTKIRLSFPQ
jgi:hypothetical protein